MRDRGRNEAAARPAGGSSDGVGVGVNSAGRAGWWWFGGVLFFLAAAWLGGVFPNPTPHYDDYFHLLAARSLLHEGDLILMDGAAPYERAWVFTYAVAASQRVFGETIGVARLPSVLAFAALAAGLFAWVGRRAGWLAALLVAGLWLGSLHGLYQAASVRFYALHALAVWLGAVGLYEAGRAYGQAARSAADSARGGWFGFRGVAGWLVLSAAGWALAWHLQATTVVAGAAVGLAALPFVVRGWWHQPGSRKGREVAGALGFATAVTAVFIAVGGWSTVRGAVQVPQLWAAHSADDWAYYHRWLTSWYWPLWWGLPLWLVLGGRRHAGLVWWSAVLLLVPVLVHSSVEVKADRYLHYALPWLCVIAGLGWAEAARIGRTLAERMTSAAGLGEWPGLRRGALGLAGLGLALGVAYGMYRTPGLERAVRMSLGDLSRNPFHRSDWSAAQAELRARAYGVDAVAASAGLRSLYFLGRVEAGLSVHGAVQTELLGSRMTLAAPPISRPEQLEAFCRQHRRVLVTVDQEHWRQPAFVPDAVADWIEAQLVAVPMPEAWRIRVYEWTDPATSEGGDPDSSTADVARQS